MKEFSWWSTVFLPTYFYRQILMFALLWCSSDLCTCSPHHFVILKKILNRIFLLQRICCMYRSSSAYKLIKKIACHEECRGAVCVAPKWTPLGPCPRQLKYISSCTIRHCSCSAVFTVHVLCSSVQCNVHNGGVRVNLLSFNFVSWWS